MPQKHNGGFLGRASITESDKKNLEGRLDSIAQSAASRDSNWKAVCGMRAEQAISRHWANQGAMRAYYSARVEAHISSVMARHRRYVSHPRRYVPYQSF